MIGKSNAARIHEQQTFQDTASRVYQNPVFTGDLPRKERKQLTARPLTRAFTPVEQAYLRAHNLRRQAYTETYEAASKVVTAGMPPMPSREDELAWSSQQGWTARHKETMDREVRSPRFAAHLNWNVLHRSNQWLGQEAEGFLTEKQQPHLYARTGALALAKTFNNGEAFHEFGLDDALRSSLDRLEAGAVRDLLVSDGVLDREGFNLRVNHLAVSKLVQLPLYVPPTPTMVQSRHF
jgi:hypothetical protein